MKNNGGNLLFYLFVRVWKTKKNTHDKLRILKIDRTFLHSRFPVGFDIQYDRRLKNEKNKEMISEDEDDNIINVIFDLEIIIFLTITTDK